jgi:hypothetical protein
LELFIIRFGFEEKPPGINEEGIAGGGTGSTGSANLGSTSS